MLEKVKQFAILLGAEGFAASNGWLERFKSCNNIKFARTQEEKAVVDFADA